MTESRKTDVSSAGFPELFHEIYGAYYLAVAEMTAAAQKTPLKAEEMLEIARRCGFAETPLLLPALLTSRQWPLFEPHENGGWHARASFVPRPMSRLEKSWLAALLEDERASLFLDDGEGETLRRILGDPAPLFRRADFHTVDRASDPDPFGDPEYRRRFRTILEALQNGRILRISYLSGKDNPVRADFWPERLQYSRKDDKFRLLALRLDESGSPFRQDTLNLGRIREARESDREAKPADKAVSGKRKKAREPVLLQLTEEREALERALIHFASFECRVKPDAETGLPLLSVHYDAEDETELLIRVLAFGPLIRVLSPGEFLAQVKKRVARQWELLESGNRFRKAAFPRKATSRESSGNPGTVGRIPPKRQDPES